VFVPYTFAVVETLMPRILDARPEFSVKGRTQDDQLKAVKQQQLMDFDWEMAKMDNTTEMVTRSSLVYGTGFLHAYWKKDVRTHDFLDTKNINAKNPKFKSEERVFYDAPYAEWVDNYSLWYDWRNIKREEKQFWFKRLILSGASIKRRYPSYDKKRLEMAFSSGGGDLENYASVRQEAKVINDVVARNVSVNNFLSGNSGSTEYGNLYNDQSDYDIRMFEVIEWYRPFDDRFCVLVGSAYVPILKKAEIPFPYDFKEAPFIEIPYLKLPSEFEGVGIPNILENPQIMLNTIKNQRLDAATLNIHKMWIVNPLANIRKDDLVTRPFGIIYSPDPQGVREVQFSDVKPSAYKEEEMLKDDMRYSVGVDDTSMGVGGGAGSATEVRHLRESTLERVRLFVNHLGDGFTDLMRYWLDMHRQFFTQDMQIRILGENGQDLYPLVEKDDLMGGFDYRALVSPSIAGQLEIQKKQDMDLFQLLSSMEFIDPKKLTAKLLNDFNWSIDSLMADEQEQPEMPMTDEEGNPIPPEMMGGQMPQESGVDITPDIKPTKQISPEALMQALSMMRKEGEAPNKFVSQFNEASQPINLLNQQGPPTAKDVTKTKKAMPNKAGLNRGGKVNTNVNVNQNSNPESNLMNRVFNIQS
jgi:hypothetical protein